MWLGHIFLFHTHTHHETSCNLTFTQSRNRANEKIRVRDIQLVARTWKGEYSRWYPFFPPHSLSLISSLFFHHAAFNSGVQYPYTPMTHTQRTVPYRHVYRECQYLTPRCDIAVSQVSMCVYVVLSPSRHRGDVEVEHWLYIIAKYDIQVSIHLAGPVVLHVQKEWCVFAGVNCCSKFHL